MDTQLRWPYQKMDSLADQLTDNFNLAMLPGHRSTRGLIIMAKGMKFVNGVTDYEAFHAALKLNKTYLRKYEVVMSMLAKQAAGVALTMADYVTLVLLVAENVLTGKLDGFRAISTSVLMNERCQKRAKCKDCICSACYAAATMNQYDSLALSMEINTMILSNFDIPIEALAVLTVSSTNGKSRIEAFGDTNNQIQAANYIKIIKSHDWLTWGVWSKNGMLDYLPVFRSMGKPRNMVFIVSSGRVNVPDKVPAALAPYVDHVFTVYDKTYAAAHNITINCGTYEGTHPIDSTCRNCGRCYDISNTEYYINEIKK